MPSALSQLATMVPAEPSWKELPPAASQRREPGVTRGAEPSPLSNWDPSLFSAHIVDLGTPDASSVPAAPAPPPLTPPPDIQDKVSTVTDAAITVSGLMSSNDPGFEPLKTAVPELVKTVLAQPPGVRAPDTFVDVHETQLAMDLGEKISTQIMDATEAFQMGDLQRYKEAEVETRQAIGDAETEAKYGMPAEDLRVVSQVFDAAAANPDDGELTAKAGEAAELLQRAQRNAQNPDPFRLWHDMSAGKQALFLFANALAIMGQAVTGKGGPTPMDMLQNMMERDYQSARDAYARREGKVTKARSAYEIAAKMTNNELERHALVMAQKWSAFERESVRLQLGMHADQARQQKAQWLQAAQFQRFSQKQDTARALLEKIIGMTAMSGRESARTARLAFLSPTDRNAFVKTFTGMQALEQMTELITRGADYSTAVPQSLIDPEAGRALFRRMQSAYAGLIRQGFEAGVMTERDREVWLSALGTWAWPPTAAQLEQIDQINNILTTGYKAREALLPPQQQNAVKEAYQAFKRGELQVESDPTALPTPAGPPPSAGEDF